MTEKKTVESKVVFGWQDIPEIGVELDRIAKDKGLHRSDLVRMIIREYINAQKSRVKMKKNKT